MKYYHGFTIDKTIELDYLLVMGFAEMLRVVGGIRFANSYPLLDGKPGVKTVVTDIFGIEVNRFDTIFKSPEEGLDRTNNLRFAFGLGGTLALAIGYDQLRQLSSVDAPSAAEIARQISFGLVLIKGGIELLYKSGEADSQFKALDSKR